MTKRLLNTQRIVNLSSNPATGTAGEMYYNTVSSELRVYNGTTWIAVGAGSGGSSVTISDTPPSSPSLGDLWFDSLNATMYIYYDSAWIEFNNGASSSSAGFPQPTEPSSPNNGSIWVDTDGDDPNYPSYPTVIYSPTQPSGLTVADVGTIWVDEDYPLPIETVVPAVLYQSTAPTGLTQNDVGYVWIDSDDNIIEYNMNDYALKTYVDAQLATAGFNPFLLAGM